MILCHWFCWAKWSRGVDATFNGSIWKRCAVALCCADAESAYQESPPSTLCHGRKTKIPRLWEANGRKHSGFLKSSSSPPGSMIPRFSTLICSLLKFLLKYIPKSNAIYYISLQRGRQKKWGFVVVDTAIIEMRPCFYFMKPRRVIHWDPDISYHLITSVARYLLWLHQPHAQTWLLALTGAHC